MAGVAKLSLNDDVFTLLTRALLFANYRDKKPEADAPSESQGTLTEICRRCLERHVEGIESCMENAYSSRSRFYVPPAVVSTECPQTCTTTTTTTSSGSSNSAPSSTSSLSKTSTVNHNHLTVPRHSYPLTYKDFEGCYHIKGAETYVCVCHFKNFDC